MTVFIGVSFAAACRKTSEKAEKRVLGIVNMVLGIQDMVLGIVNMVLGI